MVSKLSLLSCKEKEREKEREREREREKQKAIAKKESKNLSKPVSRSVLNKNKLRGHVSVLKTTGQKWAFGGQKCTSSNRNTFTFLTFLIKLFLIRVL